MAEIRIEHERGVSPRGWRPGLPTVGDGAADLVVRGVRLENARKQRVVSAPGVGLRLGEGNAPS